jgi:hypothetical protein
MEVLEDGEKKQEYEKQMKEILGKLNVIKSQRDEKKLLKEKKTKLAKKNPNLPKKGTAFNKEQHEQFLDKIKKATKKNEKMRSRRVEARKKNI